MYLFLLAIYVVCLAFYFLGVSTCIEINLLNLYFSVVIIIVGHVYIFNIVLTVIFEVEFHDEMSSVPDCYLIMLLIKLVFNLVTYYNA